jgi:SAM-dependent methyltransferase
VDRAACGPFSRGRVRDLSELDRIRVAYRERDAAPVAGSPWLDRGYRRRLQDLEWYLLESLARAGVDPSGARVLEIGCGSGYFLSRFLDYGASAAAGIDLMDERIVRARNRDPRLELVTGDASELPWADESFDLVTQFTCLSSILDPALRRRIAREMWRVLRPGGLLMSYDMRATPAAVRLLRRIAARRRPAMRPGTPTEPLEADELALLFGPGIDIRAVTLAPDIAGPAERVRLARLLRAAVPLCSHLLAVGRKQSQPSSSR